jgi:protocatechuate 3,4-dioxygenase beta subunit
VSTIWPSSFRGATARTPERGRGQGYAQTALRWPAQAARAPAPRAFGADRSAFVQAESHGADLAGHGGTRGVGQLIDGERVSVVDEDGAPLTGAMVEIWHCNAAGKYLHPNDSNDAPADLNFHGAARLITDGAGRVELRTIKPGAYPVPTADGWWRPPHIHFSVWGRVWLSRLVTQMFFPGRAAQRARPRS